MKIGFVLDDSLDRPDGVQQYVLALGEWLTSHGNEVFYLVGQTERKDIPGIHSMGRVLRVKFNGNVVGTPLPASKTAISKLLEDLKLDVIHVQVPYSPVLAGRIINAVSANTAVVGTLHIYPNSRFEHAMNRLLATINKKTLQRFDDIVAVSKVAAEASHLARKRDIKVIPNPVNIQRFQEVKHVKSKSVKIVFLGRLVPRKGCLLLLRAINILNVSGRLPKNLVVEIGGGGALLPQLKKFVKQNKLTKQVSFKGFISEDNKPGFLGSADLAVFPSSGGESFGIVLIEAMAAGAVTLGGNNPGYACVLGQDSPQLFNPKNPLALADLLEELINDKTQRQSVLAQQKQLVQQYDINVVGKAVLASYNKALRSRYTMS